MSDINYLPTTLFVALKSVTVKLSQIMSKTEGFLITRKPFLYVFKKNFLIYIQPLFASSLYWGFYLLCTWFQWLSVHMNRSDRGQSSCCLSCRILAVCALCGQPCAYVRVHAHMADVCLCQSFVCLARIDMQTGLISRDLWALTGCRLVSTATSKGWRCFTYPDGELHSCAQLHAANRSGRATRRWEVPMWSWEWKRGQHAVSVARCLWWVYERICF